MDRAAAGRGRVAFVLKGYPRLSETFIAQEILALEQRGLDILIVSLRHPTDRKTHPVHAAIRAERLYLPEYLYQEPARVWRGWRCGAAADTAIAAPGAPGSPICGATRPRTGCAGLARRWCWRPSCRRTSAISTPIFCTRRPRSRAMPR